MSKFRWNSLNLSIKALIGSGKYTPESVKEVMRESRTKSAKEEGWKPAELAAALADDDLLVDDIVRRMKCSSK